MIIVNVVCDTRSLSTVYYTSANNQTERLAIAFATVVAPLLVLLMCFCTHFLYKKLGRNNGNGLAVNVGTGLAVMFHRDLSYSSQDIIEKLEALNEKHIIGFGAFGTIFKLTMYDGNVLSLKKVDEI